MNLVLIGCRGSGKSAVAQELAQRTGRTVVSTDAEIVQRAGRTIPEFVDCYGWDAFRDLEEEVVRDAAALRDVILDTGGGVVLRAANVEALRRSGRVFWLRATVAELARRMAGDTNRPPLTGAKSFIDEIGEVLAVRTPLYAAAADEVIDCDNVTPGDAADWILGRLDDARG